MTIEKSTKHYSSRARAKAILGRLDEALEDYDSSLAYAPNASSHFYWMIKGNF